MSNKPTPVANVTITVTQGTDIILDNATCKRLQDFVTGRADALQADIQAFIHELVHEYALPSVSVKCVTAKSVIVNGEMHDVLTDRLSYDDLCHLADLSPDYSPSITWRGVRVRDHGRRAKLNGMVCHGDPPFEIEDGDVFDVAVTGNA